MVVVSALSGDVMGSMDFNVSEDPTERWKALDEAWVEQNLSVIQRAFAWFMQNGEWPEPQSLRRQVIQAGCADVDVQGIIDSKPAIPGLGWVAHPNNFKVGARHLVGVREAEPLLNLLVAVTKRAVDVYRRETDLIVESSDPKLAQYLQLVFRGMPSNETMRFMKLLPKFVAGDWPNAVGPGMVSEEGWQLRINEEAVMDFDGVGSPNDYVKCQIDILRRFAPAAETTLIQRDGNAESPVEEGPAFIIMPFRESWSNETYDLIAQVAASLEPPLPIIRADKIFEPGRITDQIVAAIQDARLVIADITGLNPNVMWELGYADALQKPVVILRQRNVEAPFDIYERRQVLYAMPLVPEDKESLRQHLLGALLSIP